MFTPGDVVLFWSDTAGKEKFHLCISLNDNYLYLNSPKSRRYEGDLALPCSDFPFLEPTPEGESIICCTMILTRQVGRRHEVKGRVSREVLIKIVEFVESSDAIADADREIILDGLGNWL